MAPASAPAREPALVDSRGGQCKDTAPATASLATCSTTATPTTSLTTANHPLRPSSLSPLSLSRLAAAAGGSTSANNNNNPLEAQQLKQHAARLMDTEGTEAAQQPLTGQPEQDTCTRGRDLEMNYDLQGGSEAFHDNSGLVYTPWRLFVAKILFTIMAFIALTLLLEHFANETITAWSHALMAHIGLPGLFLLVCLADALPQPFTYIPLIFMAVKGSIPKSVVFCICASASTLAAVLGYLVGALVRKSRRGNSMIACLIGNRPYISEMMQRRGALGVAMAALLPMPLAVATWTAGYFGVDAKQFLVAGCCRWPKIGFWVFLSKGPAIVEAVMIES